MGVVAPGHRGAGGAQPVGIAGIDDGAQHPFQVLHLVGVEDVARAAHHRRHSVGAQRLLHRQGLGVGAHQDGDVGRAERTAPPCGIPGAVPGDIRRVLQLQAGGEETRRLAPRPRHQATLGTPRRALLAEPMPLQRPPSVALEASRRHRGGGA